MVVLGIVLDTEAYECMTSVVEEDNDRGFCIQSISTQKKGEVGGGSPMVFMLCDFKTFFQEDINSLFLSLQDRCVLVYRSVYIQIYI